MPMAKGDNFVGGDGRGHGKLLFIATVLDGNWRLKRMELASTHWIVKRDYMYSIMMLYQTQQNHELQSWRKPAHTCSMLKVPPITKYLMLSMSSFWLIMWLGDRQTWSLFRWKFHGIIQFFAYVRYNSATYGHISSVHGLRSALKMKINCPGGQFLRFYFC